MAFFKSNNFFFMRRNPSHDSTIKMVIFEADHHTSTAVLKMYILFHHIYY